MKIIQVQTLSEAISELLAYGSPRPGCDHSILENGFCYTVLIDLANDLELSGDTKEYRHDDITLAISEALSDGTLDISPIKNRLDIMCNQEG